MDRLKVVALLAVVVPVGLVAVVGCGPASMPSARRDSGSAVARASTATPTPTATGTQKPSRVEVTAGPTMASERTGYTATELADGRILLTGGYLGRGGTTPCGNGVCLVPSTATAEIYDPRTRTFSPTGSMNQPRVGHAAAPLHDGRVLVVGGMYDAGGIPVGTAEIYDPATARFRDLGALHQDTSGDEPSQFSLEPSTASLLTVLDSQTLTVLADGRVLIVGGEHGAGGATSKAVTMFDPTTNRFTNLPGMPVAWANPAASRLADGRVLVTAGQNGPDGFTKEALLFDPTTNAFTLAGSTVVGREGTTQTSLQDGRVLIVNGSNCGDEIPGETYNPATGRFSVAAGSTSSPVTPLLIPDGRVLLLGSANGACHLVGQVAAYDPDSGTVSILASDALPNASIDGAFVLDDGSALVLTDEGVSFLTLE
ncbi:MAG: kelch repeat-containing protein [Candidatus Limnocylindrales bacterium]